MATKQTWTINGKTYNHEQLMELKKQGLDPRKDDIQMKFVTPQVIESEKQAKEALEQPEVVETTISTDEVVDVNIEQVESDEQEFARLKTERAWKNEDKKARYNELKEKFKK